jgi:choline dehydrogenase-like flavoprotein
MFRSYPAHIQFSNEGILELIVPGLQPQISNTYDWNYTTVPQAMVNNRSIEFRRGFVLGGSSSVSKYPYRMPLCNG